ncbi:hypothetical protein RvY_06577-2 [Ramazzottius varieornatus]|uniref:Uncharacterized protein n=1 Tax=Ramazzottius varieornatus TaxID=947166 RepID=A0A1D1V4I6_RAMVA|nr:hypothetical protein RvY_06577-2 [Ramazzottius varieornatus]
MQWKNWCFVGFLLTVRDESGTINITLGSALDITGVNYDGEYLMNESLQKITQVKKEYKTDVRYVTCDSDGAHRKARRLLSEKLPHILFSPCNAHQINLIIQDVIKFVPQFKETLRQSDVVSNWFRKSSLSQGKLRDLQFEFYSKEISMPGWTQTRWYSIYVSVQRVLDSKSALQMYGVRFGTNLGLVPFELKVVLDEDDFWAGAREIAVVLKPLVEAQEEAESDNCTIADMGAAVRNIYLSFSHLRDRDISWTRMSQLEKRWRSFYQTDVVAVAMFLHPKYKLNLFRSDPAKVHSGVIYKRASDLYRQFFRNDPTKLLTSAIHYSGSKNIFDAKYTRQLSNPIDYWSYAETEHAELAQLAKFLLSACPHAAAVERFWKKMKEVHTANRNRLHRSLVGGMCTLKMKFCREDNVRDAEKQKKTEKKAGEGETTSHCGVPTIEIEGGAIADQGSRSGDLMRLESQISELDELFAQDNEAAEEDGDGDQPALSGEKFFTLAELFNTSGV